LEETVAEIAIITDSTANIPQDLVEKYKIQVVPQVLIWDGETLLDGVDISPTEFYARLTTSKNLPTTSQASMAAFKELFEPHVQRGVPILTIVISADLSGTLQSAQQAKALFPEARIELVDSRSTAMAMGFQVLAAARAAQAGEPFEEVVKVAEAAREKSGVIFAVDTLEFLHRGGRIGGAARLLGTALNLKPLLHVVDGKVEPLEKVRTKAKAHVRLIELIAERVDGRDKVRLSTLHAASPEEAEKLLQRVQERVNPVEALITEVGPVLGTHVGPGTVGIAYCTDF
jgi:DegV family protein with EDD domain